MSRANLTIPSLVKSMNPRLQLFVYYLNYTSDTIQLIITTKYYINKTLAMGFLDEIVVTGVSKATLERKTPLWLIPFL